MNNLSIILEKEDSNLSLLNISGSINNRAPQHFVETNTFKIDGEKLPMLNYEDHYHYLGCQLGADAKAEVKKTGKQYLTEAKTIFESHLTD